MHVARVRAKVFLDEMVDRAFEHERVVDRDGPNALDTIPAWLTAARDGRVHDIVRDEEKRLQLSVDITSPSASAISTYHRLESEVKECAHEFDAPAQQSSLEVLILAELSAAQNLDAVDDRHASVQLSPRNVVIEVLHGSHHDTYSTR